MAQVDPDDDRITRYVVRYYAYDPARRERRHRTVVAFDNAADFESFIDRAAQELRVRRARGESVDPREHYTGIVKEPDDDRLQRARRLAGRAIEHGVSPPEDVMRLLGAQIVSARRED